MSSSAIDNLAPAKLRHRFPAGTTRARSAGSFRGSMLVIGYGNTLRKDDGAGPAIVERLERAWSGGSNVRFLTAHQLLPELAAELCVERVVFIDASVELPAGAVRIVRLRAGGAQRTSMTHHVAADYLLALAKAMHGRAPRAIAIAVGAGDLSLGEGLSPAVETAAGALVARLGRHLRTFVCREAGRVKDLPFMD